MLEAKEVNKTVLVFEPGELEELLEETRKQAQSLAGRRWTIADVVERLNGYRREDLTNNVIIPKLDELIDRGIILEYPRSVGGNSKRYLFRASRMADWLEDNIKTISSGGWPKVK